MEQKPGGDAPFTTLLLFLAPKSVGSTTASSIVSPAVSRPPTPPHEPKDTQIDTGLQPWLVAIGCFCLTTATYGLLSAIGLLQTHLEEHILTSSPGTSIAFITAMFGFLDLFCGQFYGVLFDLYGSRWLLPLGCVIYVVAFVGLAFSHTYAQVMACFVVAGVGGAMPTTVAFCVLGQWFERRIGMAMGIVTAGAGFGGILFSMILRPMLTSQSWKVSVLVLTIVIAALMVAGSILVRSKTAGNVDFDWRVVTECFRNSHFWVILVSIFTFEMTLFILWGTIPSYALMTGVGDQFYLMMAYNIGAIVGRLGPPALADLFGVFNLIIVMTTFTIATVLGVWMPFGAHSAPALYTVVVLMGIGTGSFSPLSSACLTKICDDPKTKLGTWVGFAYGLVSFSSLMGTPVTETLLTKYGSDGLMGFLAGALGLGLMSLVLIRWMTVGWKVAVKI